MRLLMLLFSVGLPTALGAQAVWYGAPPDSAGHLFVSGDGPHDHPAERYTALKTSVWRTLSGEHVTLPVSVAGADSVTLHTQVQVPRLAPAQPVGVVLPAAGPYGAWYWDGRIMGLLNPQDGGKFFWLPPDALSPGNHELRLELRLTPYLPHQVGTRHGTPWPRMLYALPPLVLVADSQGAFTLDPEPLAISRGPADSAWVYPAWHPTYGVFVSPDVFMQDMAQVGHEQMKVLYLPPPLAAYLGAHAQRLGFQLTRWPPQQAAYVRGWPAGPPAWLDGAGRRSQHWGVWATGTQAPPAMFMPGLVGVLVLLFLPWLTLVVWKVADNEHWSGVFVWARRSRSFEQIGRAQLLTGVSFPLALVSLLVFQSCLAALVWVAAYLGYGSYMMGHELSNQLVRFRELPLPAVVLTAGGLLLALALGKLVIFGTLAWLFGYRQPLAKQLQMEVFSSFPLLVGFHALAGFFTLAMLRGSGSALPIHVLFSGLALIVAVFYLIWHYRLLSRGLLQHLRLPPVAVALYICGLEWLPLIWLWFGLAQGQ